MRPIIITVSVVIGLLLAFGLIKKLYLDKLPDETISDSTQVVAGDTTGLGEYADPYYIETNPNLTELGKARAKLIRGCLQKAGGNTKLYPRATRELCECMADTLFAHYTPNELDAVYGLPAEEQAKEFRPIVQGCRTAFGDAIEAIQLKKSEPNVDPSLFQ